MKVRRLAAAILAFAMIFSVPVYANNDDAVAAYRQMQAKMNEYENINVFYDYKVDMVSGQSSIASRIEMNMKATGLKNPETMRINIYGRSVMGTGKAEDLTPENGVCVTQNIYYENQMLYMDAMDMKIKTEMPLPEAKEEINSTIGMADDINKLKNMTLRQDGDKRVISFTVDPEALADASLMGLENAVQNSDKDTDIRYHDVHGEYVIDQEGNLLNARVYATIDMKLFGESVTANLVGEVGVAAPSQPVDIATPNLAEYEFID